MEKSYIGSSGPEIELRLDFPHSYKVGILKEAAGAGEKLHYFPAARHHDCDGLLLSIVPEQTGEWRGLFAALPGGRYKNGIYSCPDMNRLCVVSNGAGYLFDVRDPDGYEEIQISPILEAVTGIEVELLIFANFTDVLALCGSGIKWLAERISFDGIQDLRIEEGKLCGMAWSPMDGKHPFRLDLDTGATCPT